MILHSYELQPRSSRKSFYGKAVELTDESGDIYLKSYDTIVAKISGDKLFIRDEYSVTTNRHIYAFAAEHGFDCENVKDLRKIIAESEGQSFEVIIRVN